MSSGRSRSRLAKHAGRSTVAKVAALIVSIMPLALTTHSGPADVSAKGPEQRALNFLAREVPKWSAENKCYSCHNNGDAARALYTAVRLGYALPDKALADTTAWLMQPQRWDHNGGEGPYSDKHLARLQFAAALTEAMDAGLAKDRQALKDAAALIAGHQQSNGSWQVTADGTLGSPVTHGTPLATALARRTLQRADAKSHAAAIAKAEQWLRNAPVKTVLDAAGILLALAVDYSSEADKQRQRCLEMIRLSQSPDGGWGPTVKDSPEVFDTAIVVLALASQRQGKELQAMIRRGRAFLVDAQKEDGSWTETTRPSGAISYAQRLSTCGWATMALLATREGKP